MYNTYSTKFPYRLTGRFKPKPKSTMNTEKFEHDILKHWRNGFLTGIGVGIIIMSMINLSLIIYYLAR